MLAFDMQRNDPFGDIPITQPPRRPAPPPMLGQPQAPLPGIPRQASPQTPGQEQGQALQNVHTQLENQNLPLSAAAQAANAARARQETQQGNTRGVNFTDENTLRAQYRSDPRVQGYETILPLYRAAQGAADTPAGDYNVVTAFAKISDPSTGIRQGEQEGVESTATPDQRVQGLWNFYTHGRGRLTPETRAQLLAELARRGSAWDTLYNTARSDVRHNAQRYGFEPQAIIGTHAALPFRQQMGLDAPPTVQAPTPDHSGEDVVFSGEPRAPAEYQRRDPAAAMQTWQAQEQALFDNGATREQMDEASRARGAAPYGPELDAAIAWRDRHGRGARIVAPTQAPERTMPQGDPNSMSEAVGANVRGAANAGSAGLANPLAALYDTYKPGGSGTVGENLWRQNEYDAANQQAHPYATIAGNLEGAFALPTGAPGAAKAAATEAMRAGLTRAEAISAARVAAGQRLGAEGAIYGGIHGTATGEGDLRQRLGTGAFEAGLGGLTGYAGRFGPGFGRTGSRIPQLPPLVDQTTGRLNQPLESASAAQRVAAAMQHGINLPLGAATDRGGAILEKGLDVSPISAGVMNDARRGVEAQAAGALENVAGRYGTARTMDEAGRALQTGANNWISRFRQVASKAYDAIPIRPDTRASLSNTVTTLRDMTSRFGSNPDMAEIMQNPTLVRYRQALENGGLTWQEMKAFRSSIGDQIGEARFSDSPARSDLRGLYGALSEDMRATAAAQGPNALRTFDRANTLYAQGEQRIEGALVRVLGDNSRNNPEAAAAAVQTIARSGRGSSNLQQLAQIRASMVKGGEWDDVAGSMIRLMGQPTNSAGRGFNPQTFVQNYADMAEPARALLFGGGQRQELRKALDGFVAVTQRLAGTNALRNTSNTTPGMIGAGAVGSVGGAVLAGLMNPFTAVKAGAAIGANYGLARAWVNPGFVRWATGYAKMAAGPSRGVIPASYAQRMRQSLGNLARSSPDIADTLFELDQRLFGQPNGPPNP